MCKGRDMDWVVPGLDSPDTASDSCDVFFCRFYTGLPKSVHRDQSAGSETIEGIVWEDIWRGILHF